MGRRSLTRPMFGADVRVRALMNVPASMYYDVGTILKSHRSFEEGSGDLHLASGKGSYSPRLRVRFTCCGYWTPSSIVSLCHQVVLSLLLKSVR